MISTIVIFLASVFQFLILKASALLETLLPIVKIALALAHYLNNATVFQTMHKFLKYGTETH